METQVAADEAEIRARIDALVEAIRAADLEALKSIYAPDVVSFDAEPPLQQVGLAGKLNNWVEAFRLLQQPIGYDVRDLSITVSGDLAFAHSFNRLSGVLKNGSKAGGFWVRVTCCFRKINGTWLIAHDHVSVPLDLESGRGVLNLEP